MLTMLRRHRLAAKARVGIESWAGDDSHRENWESPTTSMSDVRHNHGTTFHIAPSFDQSSESDISKWFDQYYSIRFRNYPVSDDYLHGAEQVM